MIHDPERVLFSWLEDEGEAAMMSTMGLIEKIRNANKKEIRSLKIMQDQCPSVCYKNIKLGDNALDYLQINCSKEFQNNGIDEYRKSILQTWKPKFGTDVLLSPNEKSLVMSQTTKGEAISYQFHEAKKSTIVPLVTEQTDNLLFEFVVLKKDKDEFEEYLYPAESNFEKYQEKIFDHEGGFVDDPIDFGGATNKGITFNTFEAYAKEDLGIEPTLDNLKKLTNEQAAIIYKKRYWDKIKADEIENGSIAICYMILMLMLVEML